ncbi:pseudouridine synthase [Paenibacillus sp. SYP-B4298]|uniref:pseudouridine synthase n=1 Tax=Paenibacillus sp. SYP-B4298 TaxID=2996034 RepID=UPI003FA6E5B5
MRVDKLLANMGCGTRSEIKRAVKQGMVTVDGQQVKDSGLQVDPALQRVEYNGERVFYRSEIYLLLNKPQGVVSATEDHRDRTVIDLLREEDRILQPFPVGRLDKDTEGLLLLTNDGQLAHELLSPRKHVNKTYEARVRGRVDEQDRQQFAAGVTLDDGYVTMPAELTVLEVREQGQHEHEENDMDSEHDAPARDTHSWIRLTIQEGKFHQVKRMFEAVGKKVLELRRVAMGPLQLDPALASGQYRELTAEEVARLRAHRGGKPIGKEESNDEV